MPLSTRIRDGPADISWCCFFMLRPNGPIRTIKSCPSSDRPFWPQTIICNHLPGAQPTGWSSHPGYLLVGPRSLKKTYVQMILYDEYLGAKTPEDVDIRNQSIAFRLFGQLRLHLPSLFELRKTYRTRATSAIQSPTVLRKTGFSVSSISPYSAGIPVLHFWKRWFRPSSFKTRFF